jgi:hypothetical protein
MGPRALASAVHGGEWPSSHVCCFIPGGRASGITHRVGHWVDAEADLDN